MTQYEQIIIESIKSGFSDDKIVLNVLHAFDIHYLSVHDRIFIYKDIEYFRNRIAQGKSLPTGFMRWRQE